MPGKKTFEKALKDNPAMQFISPASAQLEPVGPAVHQAAEQSAPAEALRPALSSRSLGKPPEGYKYDTQLIETKSRKVNSLIRPSLHDALKAMAAETGESVNEHLNKAIEVYVDAHAH